MEMPEIPRERGDDLHNIEYLDGAELVLFMAGNQFMVMEDILGAFQEENKQVKKIFYETLPPGLELRQILAGGARFGEVEIKVTPDIYTSVTEDAMKKLMGRGFVDDFFVYLHNRIVLMVPEENKAGIRSVNDLAREDVRISQPGPLEDITRYIVDMYREAGGEALVRRIMEEKRAAGTTILTMVHHRETPLRIKEGSVDVGPVWATEFYNARREGLRVTALEPGKGLDQRHKVNYYIAKLRNGPNPQNAGRFLEFIRSSRAQEIYKGYGFIPHFR